MACPGTCQYSANLTILIRRQRLRLMTTARSFIHGTERKCDHFTHHRYQTIGHEHRDTYLVSTVRQCRRLAHRQCRNRRSGSLPTLQHLDNQGRTLGAVTLLVYRNRTNGVRRQYARCHYRQRHPQSAIALTFQPTAIHLQGRCIPVHPVKAVFGHHSRRHCHHATRNRIATGLQCHRHQRLLAIIHHNGVVTLNQVIATAHEGARLTNTGTIKLLGKRYTQTQVQVHADRGVMG